MTMKRIKKFSALFLALVMLMSLAACGSNDSIDTSAADTSTDTTSTDTSDSSAEANTSEDIAWPEQAIEIVVPYATGGDTDAYARILAGLLEQELGSPVVVTNMTGSGGSVASSYVKDADPDGYTVLWSHMNMIVNYLFGITDWNYDALDLACTCIDDEYSTYDILTDNKYGWKTIQDVIDYGLEHPGEITFGVQAGSFSYLHVLAFEKATGVDFNLVDVGGSGEMITALLNGSIDITTCSFTSAGEYYKEGSFTCLGTTSSQRSDSWPDIPTLSEQGVDLVVSKTFGFYFPKGTDTAIISKFCDAVEAVVQNKEFTDLCTKYGTDPIFTREAEAAAKMDTSYEVFAAIADSL